MGEACGALKGKMVSKHGAAAAVLHTGPQRIACRRFSLLRLDPQVDHYRRVYPWRGGSPRV